MSYGKNKLMFTGVAALGLASFAYFGSPLFSVTYNTDTPIVINTEITSINQGEQKKDKQEPEFVVTHIETPTAVKAIYMTSWVAGTKKMRDRLIGIIDDTEINSVVIDIKDYSGIIAFEVSNPILKDAEEIRIPSIKEFIGLLHSKGIYVIGRITVFQDPLYANANPTGAVQKESDRTVWKDYKGLSFVDAGNKKYWKYIVAVSKESYSVGFDELNFDYIRFPSDGNMRDIYYPISEKRILADPDFGKAKIMRDFFRYLNEELSGVGVITSADLFGMSMTNKDDLNIGQVLEYASPYFDYIAPMVYPSHYPRTFIGLDNPNKYPYEVVKYSMDRGVERLISASTSPLKLRPWLQDFDYGGDYGVKEVKAQIQATYDAGLTSWMLWDPSNRYTVDALVPIE